jgi:hypothetical protein
MTGKRLPQLSKTAYLMNFNCLEMPAMVSNIAG